MKGNEWKFFYPKRKIIKLKLSSRDGAKNTRKKKVTIFKFLSIIYLFLAYTFSNTLQKTLLKSV